MTTERGREGGGGRGGEAEMITSVLEISMKHNVAQI